MTNAARGPQLPYAIFDSDTHYYEPDDCFTRHIEARFKDQTVWIDRSSAGPGKMYVGRERCHFFSVGAGDSIGAPGIMKAFLRGEITRVSGLGAARRVEVALKAGAEAHLVEIDAPRDLTVVAGETVGLLPRAYRIFQKAG